jgi:ribosomal protein S4
MIRAVFLFSTFKFQIANMRLVLAPYCVNKKLIRMAWSKYNLYNMAVKKPVRETSNLRKTVYQQRWTAKRELRAYHVPNITERQLLARHFTSQIKLQHLSKKDMAKVPPVQALGFAELERRVDVTVFRSHFAKSIWEARRLVVQGHVQVNGEKVWSFGVN